MTSEPEQRQPATERPKHNQPPRKPPSEGNGLWRALREIFEAIGTACN